MSQKGKITITFNDNPINGEFIRFKRGKDINGIAITPILMESTFYSGARTSNNRLPINAFVSTAGEAAAAAYVQYFQIDQNISNLMTIQRTANVVVIEIELLWNFESFETNGTASVVIEQDITPAFFISEVNVLESTTDTCNFVRVRVLTSQQSDSWYFKGGLSDQNTVVTNPFFIEVPRTQPKEMVITKNLATPIDLITTWYPPNTFLYIRKIYQSGIEVVVSPSPLVGATVTVNITYANQLEQTVVTPSLTYSLDNVTFGTSNVFTGQAEGDYTIYIKDNLGCTSLKNFSVEYASSGRPEFVSISDLNSIGFAQSQIWDGYQNGIEKNKNNVLAMTGRQDNLFEERLVYRNEDELRIQFKSSYTNQTVTIEDCEGDQLSFIPTVEKMSNNLNLFEWLEATIIPYGDNNNLTAVFFTVGKRYNEAAVEIGTYELNGNLPDFAYIGNLVEVVSWNGAIGGVHAIVDIVFDQTLGKNIIIFNYQNNFSGQQQASFKSYYDLLPFEVYEFNMNFPDIGAARAVDLLIRLRIQFVDNLYDERNYYSNWIEVIGSGNEYSLNKYFSINYSNNNNRSIFYLYGIKHFIRVEVLLSNAIIDDTVDVVKGDLTTYLSESIVNQGIKIQFAEVTEKVMVKIVLALSSDNLFINGIGYVKFENVEVVATENTNLYLITSTVLESGQNFNTFINNRTGNNESYREPIYMPGLIRGNEGDLITT